MITIGRRIISTEALVAEEGDKPDSAASLATTEVQSTVASNSHGAG